jgi:tetratricopeptide (TPR) repeat protein
MESKQVDNATKRELKADDKFVTVTGHGLQWAQANKRSALVTSGIVLAVILVLVGGFALFAHRSAKASEALGAAMATYQTPLAFPGQPATPGQKQFATASERAAAANTQFADIASRYGMTRDGKVAKYFTGLTFMEEGQNQSAEDALKSVSTSWNKDLAALAKLALAQLYRQTNRDAQAITLYQELAKADASTVPAGMAQIKLAELYEAQGKTDEAKKIYAQLKDKDKDEKGQPGPVATLAAQKLNPKAAQGAEAQ